MSTAVPRVWLTTLGCAKNEVDSDKIAAQLADAGYRRVDEIGAADVVMVNTCAFIEAARRESIDAVLEASSAKRDEASVVVLGCLAQRYGTELADALPEADDVVGIDRYSELVGRLDRLTGWEPVRFGSSPMDILYEVRRPQPTTPYAYVKVAEGCDKPCTFCAIPQFRGAQISRPVDNIRSEIEALAAQGVGEIVLVAQDLASYGRDIGTDLVELLRRVSSVAGVRRLRLLYLYPREITARLIVEMIDNPLIVPYFDLSLQHSSASLLREMKRPGDGDKHRELITSIRGRDPQAAFRSSFIVGFPGETEDDVDHLARFLELARLDWAGFFPYSPETGTAASSLSGRIPDEVVAERLRRLQQIQEDITAEQNAAQVGRVAEVVVDMIEDGTAVGRGAWQAPEIDGVILLDRGRPGEWLEAKITGAYGQELAGEVIG